MDEKFHINNWIGTVPAVYQLTDLVEEVEEEDSYELLYCKPYSRKKIDCNVKPKFCLIEGVLKSQINIENIIMFPI